MADRPGPRASRPRDASEIGRTALALATSLRGDAHDHRRVRAATRAEDRHGGRVGPSYDEADRKLVRNRLIVLGTIVVVGGAALLRFVGEGGGRRHRPDWSSACTIDAGRAEAHLTPGWPDGDRRTAVVGADSGGTVVSPVAGAPVKQVKAGSSVTLTYTEGDVLMTRRTARPTTSGRSGSAAGYRFRRDDPSRRRSMAAKRRLLGDRYELGDVIGYGGMAEVHRGRDIRLGRDVAIKLLRSDLSRDPAFEGRFRREAQSAASLNSPSIVAVYDTGEGDVDGTPTPYIVMEYVEGQTLRDMLAAEGRLLPQRALEITAAVCTALEQAHAAGIVHRDIKPGNVMVTTTGEVKVMDFGIARALTDVDARR